jgi:NAD-dependent SIR2 family protein deacetylase
MTINEDVVEAHRHSSCHRKELMASTMCACFYCKSTFQPQKIEEWIDEEETALCPACGIDSVIGSASGYPITEDFLSRMHAHWFEQTHSLDEAWAMIEDSTRAKDNS